MATRGPAMSFPRGLAVESLLHRPQTAAKDRGVASAMEPGEAPRLKVWLHSDLRLMPHRRNFKSCGARRRTERCVGSLQRRGSWIGASELQLSKAEAAAFASAPGAMAERCRRRSADFWSGILIERAQHYRRRARATAAYENGNEPFAWRMTSAFAQRDVESARAIFPLLDGASLNGGKDRWRHRCFGNWSASKTMRLSISAHRMRVPARNTCRASICNSTQAAATARFSRSVKCGP